MERGIALMLNRDEAIAFVVLMAYGTLVMILWPLERLTRRRG